MNVEPHCYIKYTVYIGNHFYNILLKKCKGFIKGKIFYIRQLKQLSGGNIATTKNIATLLSKSKSLRLGENKENRIAR